MRPRHPSTRPAPPGRIEHKAPELRPGGRPLPLPRHPTACLQVHLPDGRVHSFALSRPRSSIGRSGHNDLVIADLALSKEHALIEKRGEEFVLLDAGSRNGTFLNDFRLHEPAPLSHGDTIRMGSCRLYFFSEAIIDHIGDPISDITTQIGLAPLEPDPWGRVEPTGFTFSQQLALARIIQRCLLPKGPPDLPGYEIFADAQPCYAVGGDFYDFQRLEDGTFCFLLGDVARKGIPAAMMANYSQALVRGAWNYEHDLSSLMTRVNRELWIHSPPNQFVTMCVFQMDPGTGEACYLNAGHCPPLMIHPDGEPEWMEERSLVLGIQADEVYTCAAASIPPGGLLVLYSDGVTECRCEEGDEFERERLAAFFTERHRDPLDALVADLEAELQGYCAGPMPEDDVTILILRRES